MTTAGVNIRVDPYPFGQGSYADIYFARGPHDEALVAKAALKGAKKNLRKEAYLLGRLNHPHIVRFYGTLDDTHNTHSSKIWAIVLDYCGKDMYQEYIAGESNAMTPQIIDAFSQQLFETLVFLGSQRILHRDISPANLFFDRSRNHLTVSDFGLACKKWDHNYRVQIFSCRAPEVVLQIQYGQEIDVWSAGIVILWLILQDCVFPQTVEDNDDLPSRSHHLRLIAHLIDEPPPQHLWGINPLIDYNGNIKNCEPYDQLTELVSRRTLEHTIQVARSQWPGELATRYATILDKIFRWNREGAQQILNEIRPSTVVGNCD